MYEIDQASGQVVATDTQRSVEAVDQAVMSLANLCASIVEVSKASRLPIGSAQSALSKAGEGLTKIIDSRADMSEATRELVSLQKASSLRTVSFGCPELPSARHAEASASKMAA